VLDATPRPFRIFFLAIGLLALGALANFVFQIARKPTELFFPVSGALNKGPSETWREYGPLFRQYATPSIPPELLAALAQAEGAGNPVARTYWSWRLSWNPFDVYRPASSAVGMYQMTDPAFAEARRYCIRDHTVTENCWFNAAYMRVLPSHAIELTAAHLDRSVAAILAARPGAKASPGQKQELALILHLCGAGPAAAFARAGYQLPSGMRCGDHVVAVYLARVSAMKRIFLKLAAEE
jgi:hypothetical protein